MRKAVLMIFIASWACAESGPETVSQAHVLQGTVEDPNHAPVAGASLTLANQAGNVGTANSDLTGRFRFDGLGAGDYVLTAKAEGFKEFAVDVQIGAPAVFTQRVRLKVAAVVQELTVSATVDRLAADGNTDALQVDKDLLKSLPVKEGNPLAVATLFLDPASTGVEGPTVVVDGVETSGLDVPESSVKKVFVNKNPYAAEFSRPGKGRIEVTTRPGSTSRIRHRVILTMRDSALDARNAFAAERPPARRALFEGEVDGRLGSKGTFYAGTDYLRDDQNGIVSALEPSGRVNENVPAPERAWRSVARLDYRLTPLHNLSLRYNRNRGERRNQGIGAFDLPQRGYHSEEDADEVRVDESATVSPHFFNEVRLSFKDRNKDARSLTGAPALLVPGAFHGGGAQISRRQGERVLELQNLGNLIQGRHTLRFGGGVKRRYLDALDESNFGGTYAFSSLADFAANRPFLFAVNRGNPAVAFQQTDFSTFAQDDVRLRPNLGLLAGIRYEVQSQAGDLNNVAPRLSLSYSPGQGRTVFRVGGGTFYERQPWAMRQSSLLLDGTHIRQIVIADPRFPDPDAAAVVSPLSITRIAAGIRSPYLLQASAGVEQKFGKATSVAVEYRVLRGSKLYRMRNVNAPLPLTGQRPDPAFLNIDQFESSGISRSRAVTVTLRTGYRTWFELLSQYTLASTLDDTSGLFALPADNYDLRGEFGRADYDRRHRLNSAGILRLPRGWKLGTILTLSSGAPFNITTGADDNHDTVANDRPAGVRRNSGGGPGLANADLRLSRRFYTTPDKQTKSPYVELRFDAFNVLNHVNPVTYIGVRTSPLFGRANAALPARQMQVSAKFSF